MNKFFLGPLGVFFGGIFARYGLLVLAIAGPLALLVAVLLGVF